MPRVKNKEYPPLQKEVTKPSAPETTEIVLVRNIFLSTGKALAGTKLIVPWLEARQFVKSGKAVFT